MPDPVTFYAAVAKVQTLADGGIRIWLDLPEGAIMPAAELMAYQVAGVVLDFVGTERKAVTDCNDEAEKESKRGGPEMDGRRIAIRRDK